MIQPGWTPRGTSLLRTPSNTDSKQYSVQRTPNNGDPRGIFDFRRFFKLLNSTLASKGVILAIALLLGPTSVLFSVLNSPQRVYAAPNNTLNFQARLLTNTGNLVADGYYNIEFKLYNATTSTGTPNQGFCTMTPGSTADTGCFWRETRYDTDGAAPIGSGNDYRVRVTNGYFSVVLGDTTNGGTAFPSTIDWSSQLYMTMRVGGSTQTATPTYDTEMTPRIQLTAVPLAFMANNVNSGNTAAASTASANALLQSGNATGTTSNSGSITLQSGTATSISGNLGISTGNATTTSGNITLDVGTGASKGTISIGATNASALTIGSTGVTTTIAGNLTVNGTTAYNDIVTITATSPNLANGSALRVSATATSTTNNQVATSGTIIASPSSASSRSYMGLNGYATTASGNMASGVLFGTYSGAEFTGTGTLNQAWAMYLERYNTTTGTINAAYGLGISNLSNPSGTVTRNTGIAVQNQTTGTNNTNLLLGSFTAPVGNWSIHSTSSYDSAINGKLRIGSVTAPSTTLDVIGTGSFSSDLTVGGIGTFNGNLAFGDASTDTATFTANVLASNAATGTTGTSSGTGGTNVTSITLAAAGAFANGDVILVDNTGGSGQDYYTRITAGGGTTTITVDPAVSYGTTAGYTGNAAITKYNVQNIGAANTGTTFADSARFFQGYFLGGVRVGAGSTVLSDQNLSSTQALYLNTGGTGTKLTVSATGNVGIGTTAPGSALHVLAATVDLRVADTSATGNPKISLYQAATERAFVQYDNTTITTMLDSDGLIGFNTNNTRALTIQSAGNVGIGNTNNTYKLDVTGNVNSTTGYLFNGTAGATTTCAGGNVLSNQVVQGGITTGGTCSAAGSGTVTTSGTPVANQVAYFNAASVIQGSASYTYNDSTGVLALGKNQTTSTNLSISNGNAGLSAFAQLNLTTDAGTGTLFMNSIAQTAYGGAGSLNLGTGTARGFSILTNNVSHLIVSSTGTTTQIGPVNTSFAPASWTQNLILDNAATSTQNITEFRVAGTRMASIRVDNAGNVVLGGVGTGATYLALNEGSGGVQFGNGAGGVNAFVTAAGAFGGGTYNSQTVSSAANFTGTLNVASSISVGGVGVITQGGADVYANIRVIRNLSASVQDGMYVNYGSSGSAGSNSLRLYDGGTANFVTIGSGASISAPGTVSGSNLTTTGSLTVSNNASIGGALIISGNTQITPYAASNNVPVCQYFGYLANCTSSRALKHDITDSTYGLSQLRQLRAVQYTWNGENRKDAGFIAEEVAGIVPETTQFNNDGTVKSFNPDAIISVLTKALQQLDLQVQDHETRLLAVESGHFAGNITAIGDIATAGNLTVAGTAQITKLTVTGDTVLQKLTVNGKIITGGAAPQVALGAAAGDAVTAFGTITGNDTAGTLSIKAGANGTVAGQILGIVTFNSPYDQVPTITLSATSADSAAIRYYLVKTTTGWSIKVLDAPVAGKTYSFDYHVIQ